MKGRFKTDQRTGVIKWLLCDLRVKKPLET